jgi:hypothetical protein
MAHNDPHCGPSMETVVALQEVQVAEHQKVQKQATCSPFENLILDPNSNHQARLDLHGESWVPSTAWLLMYDINITILMLRGAKEQQELLDNMCHLRYVLQTTGADCTCVQRTQRGLFLTVTQLELRGGLQTNGPENFSTNTTTTNSSLRLND